MKYRNLCLLCVTLLLLLVSPAMAFATDEETTTEPINGFYYIENDEYEGLFFYENGIPFIPETYGLYEKNGATYYFYDTGEVFEVEEPGLYETDEKTYYFFEDSTVKTVAEPGFYDINGIYCYIQEDHSVYTPGDGRYKVDGKYYYFFIDGEILVDDWNTTNGKTSYYTRDGALTGKQTLSDSYTYYFNQYGNLITSKTAKRSILKVDGKNFEIRSQAKLQVYGYDTLQGSCTDGTYGYYVMNNRTNNKCKIVKVNLETMTVVKVSKVLEIGHGNGITYNPIYKYLVVVHNQGKPMRLSTIKAKNLTLIEHIDLEFPDEIQGATSKQVKNIKKFGSISYNHYRDVYVVLLSNSHNLLVLNRDFTPRFYLVLSEKPSYVYQSIDATDDYILIGLSPSYSSQSNMISVYEWDGTHRFNINIKLGYELESIYHIGNDLYAGFYRSYNQTYYKTVKKTYTVKKKVNGKIKKAKKVKKVKVKDTRLMRSNYIYQLTDYLWDIQPEDPILESEPEITPEAIPETVPEQTIEPTLETTPAA